MRTPPLSAVTRLQPACFRLFCQNHYIITHGNLQRRKTRAEKQGLNIDMLDMLEWGIDQLTQDIPLPSSRFQSPGIIAACFDTVGPLKE
jgi:hypothetical protein